MKQMKILFDARYIRTDFHDGISRYSFEIAAALARLTSVTFLICNEKQRQFLPENSKAILIHEPTSFKEPFTAFILNKHRPDAVYTPMQTMGTFGRCYKSVLTIHDLIYFRHLLPPKNLPLAVRVGWRIYHLSYWPQRLLLRGSDVVCVVSNTTAKDVRRAKMVPKNKPLSVVYNAPQQFSTYPVKHRGVVENIVYMGSFMPYKNVETLIKAMQWLPGRKLHLLSRVSPDRRSQLEALIPASVAKTGGQVIFYNGVSDSEYEQVLANNAVLVTASLDEGYGIPVAEAMAMGVPVVASDIPVFHEVGGQGIIYCPAKDAQGFAMAIKSLDTPDKRQELTTEAKKHISRFNWDESARVLLGAIEKSLVK